MDVPPIPVTPAPGLTPSGSTIGSSVGGAIAVVLITALHQALKWEIDPGTAAAITVLCCAAAGYLPASGRR